MSLSVIIPTKNRREDLLITLRSLLSQSRTPEEIIIVDQSRESSEEEILRLMEDSAIRLKYVRDEQISGQTEARLRGLKEAGGDVVFFLDDDITLDKDCIKNLLRIYEENPHLGGVCAIDTAKEDMGLCRLLMTSLFNCGPFSGKEGGWFYTDLIVHRFHKRFKGLHYTWAFFGGFMSFKKRVVEEIGFDEKLRGGVFAEDIDLAFRVSRKYPLAMATDVRVLHRGGEALYSLKWSFERKVLARWYFFLKDVKKTPANTLCFLWSLFGLMITATTATVSSSSLEPLRGFLSAIHGVSVGNSNYPPMRTILNKKGNGQGKRSRKEEPLRVLQVITRLIPGGATDIALNLCRGLKERGLHVELAGAPDTRMTEEVLKNGVPFHPIPEFKREVHPLYDPLAFLKLYALIGKGRYQIVHTHTSKAGILGRLAARLAHTPVIVHTPQGSIFHPTFFSLTAQRFFALVERLAALWADKIIGICQSEVRDYLDLRIAPREKYMVIHGGLNLDKFRNVQVNVAEKRKELGLPEDAFVIGIIARLSHEKGHFVALEAFQKVRRAIPNALLLVVGDGELSGAIHEGATKMGISDRVVMTGYRGDIPEITRLLDVSLHPSLWDASPRSILEAMVCEVPVVATGVGGIPEIVVDGETGLLVSSGDAEAMASCILRLRGDGGLRKRLTANAAEGVRTLFDPTKTVDRTVELYQEILARKGFLIET